MRSNTLLLRNSVAYFSLKRRRRSRGEWVSSSGVQLDILPNLVALLFAYVLALPIAWDRERNERKRGSSNFPSGRYSSVRVCSGGNWLCPKLDRKRELNISCLGIRFPIPGAAHWRRNALYPRAGRTAVSSTRWKSASATCTGCVTARSFEPIFISTFMICGSS